VRRYARWPLAPRPLRIKFPWSLVNLPWPHIDVPGVGFSRAVSPLVAGGAAQGLCLTQPARCRAHGYFQPA